MRHFTRGLALWLSIGFKMAHDGLKEPRKKKVILKPLWYDELEKSGRD